LSHTTLSLHPGILGSVGAPRWHRVALGRSARALRLRRATLPYNCRPGKPRRDKPKLPASAAAGALFPINETTVFLVSDRTGITVDTMVHTLLTQFDEEDFERVTLPFMDNPERYMLQCNRSTRRRTATRSRRWSSRAWSTTDCREALRGSRGVLFDFFDAFIGPLESVLGRTSAHAMGRSHGMGNTRAYDERLEAVNFALSYDDGARPPRTSTRPT